MTPTNKIADPNWGHIHERDIEIQRLRSVLRNIRYDEFFCRTKGSYAKCRSLTQIANLKTEWDAETRRMTGESVKKTESAGE